jgi:hypothetical protein
VEAAKVVAEYNGEVDEFERQFRAADPEAVSRFFTFVLDASDYLEGFGHRTRSNSAMRQVSRLSRGSTAHCRRN